MEKNNIHGGSLSIGPPPARERGTHHRARARVVNRQTRAMGKKASGAKCPGGGAGASGTISKRAQRPLHVHRRPRQRLAERACGRCFCAPPDDVQAETDAGQEGQGAEAGFASKELPSTRIVPDRSWREPERVAQPCAVTSRDAQRRRKSPSARRPPSSRRSRRACTRLGGARGRKAERRRVNLLGNAPFNETFSAGRRQKRPKLATGSYEPVATARAAASARGSRRRHRRRRFGGSRPGGAATAATLRAGRSSRRARANASGASLYKVVAAGTSSALRRLYARDPHSGHTGAAHLEHRLKKAPCTSEARPAASELYDLHLPGVTRLHALSRGRPRWRSTRPSRTP